jgi:chitinase
VIKKKWSVAIALVIGVLASGFFFQRSVTQSTSTAATPTTGAAPRFAPYAYTGLAMPSFPSRHVVLSFITANGCTPTWNGTPLAAATTVNTRITQAQAIGDEVIASFGGESGPDLAVSCTNPTQLAASYQTVISRYGLKTIDLDVESAALDPTAGARRAQAIATVQKTTHVAVWLTLGVAPTGLLPNSLAVVKQMMAAGVTVSGVNVMAFDYGPLAAGQTELSVSESAVSDTESQIAPLGLSWSELGATIMVGNTDTTGQQWSLAAAQSFWSFAYGHRLGRLSEWSLNRDQQCSGTQPHPSNSCSGVTQQAEQFSHILGNN